MAPPERSIFNMSNPKTTLLTLPDEVIEKICMEAIDSKGTVCVSRLRRRDVNEEARPAESRPTPLSNLKTLLETNSTLRKFAQQWLARNSRFFAKSTNFLNFPEVFGRSNAVLLEHLELHLSFTQKVQHERDWPGLLGMFCTDLPNLAELVLSTSWELGRPPYPTQESGDPQGSLTREDQERRAALRFGAFLVLRHPKLRRMISQADSGSSFEVGESRASVRFILDKGLNKEAGDFRRKWNTMEKWVNETRIDKVHCEVSIKKLRGYNKDRNADLMNRIRS